MTLQQLALASGRSVGFLSQIERNLTRPSVTALQDVSSALDVHIGWFFPEDVSGDADERDVIVRANHRRKLTYSELSGTEYLGLHDHLLVGQSQRQPGTGYLALRTGRFQWR